ncbi:hypothetical protein [Paenibacillus apiarius]|uniref:hypothetical protein n=1 Tax=Paenibacillus apiarius TaxID=46240 RepID=UPI003B3A15DB
MPKNRCTVACMSLFFTICRSRADNGTQDRVDEYPVTVYSGGRQLNDCELHNGVHHIL